MHCFAKVAGAGHRQKSVLHGPGARYFGRTLISKKNVFVTLVFMICIKAAHKPLLYPCRGCGDPSKALWIQRGLSSSAGGWNGRWFLNSGRGKAMAVPQLHSSGVQLWGGEQEQGKGPGNANQARGESSPACSCSCSCEHDRPGWGRCRFLRKKKKFFCFPHRPPPAPWKCRMHFVNSKYMQSHNGHFPFPCLLGKREFVAK